MSAININTHNELYKKYQKHILNKEETAKELQVSTATIDRMRKSGKIRSKLIGGQIFFKLSEVSDFLDA